VKKKNIFQRAYWRFLRYIGLGAKSWDIQFRKGVWSRDTCSPNVVERVVKLCDGGRLVEFGCGLGGLPRSVPEGTFSSYLGIDISNYAIQEADKRAAAHGISNYEFRQCDMKDWPGDNDVSLIVIEECLNYLSGNHLRKFLTHCCDSLNEKGTILVIIWSAKKHADTLDMCREVCNVMHDDMIGTRTCLTLTKKE
jgi:cyclopropane fatty-acyl-phospholipid synthase-like methyltransferase